MRHRIPGWILALVVVGFCLAGLRADEPTLTRLALPADYAGEEAWYGIYVGGTKSGWAHETARRIGSGRRSKTYRVTYAVVGDEHLVALAVGRRVRRTQQVPDL